MDLMEKIVSLSKRRGFIFPGSEIYGGLANSWDYGPVGSQLKKNIKDIWWKTFVENRTDILGLDASLIMNPRVWEASGHVEGFSDPLVEDKVTHERFRLDHFLEANGVDCNGLSFEQMAEKIKELKLKSPEGNPLSEPKKFNMMLQTQLGSTSDTSSSAYLRPETAQAMFVDFKNIISTNPKKLPFGIAQQGKAFRNEITTGNFIFRVRELEQMEIEYFFKPGTDEYWNEIFEMWRKEFWNWFNLVGIDSNLVVEHEIPDGERAHYSKRTIDFEFKYPFGQKELYGLAYRGDYDMERHQKFSGSDLTYTDSETGEKFLPHVIEPTWGVERTILAILLSAYAEEGDRIILKFKPRIAPYKVAVFPLVRNKAEITTKARSVFDSLKNTFTTVWDDRGNIGKRYYSQDEIGTPWCVTVDYQTLEDDTVTVRERDSASQTRLKISELDSYFLNGLK